jgi:hypothetical protein
MSKWLLAIDLHIHRTVVKWSPRDICKGQKNLRYLKHWERVQNPVGMQIVSASVPLCAGTVLAIYIPLVESVPTPCPKIGSVNYNRIGKLIGES